MKVNPTNQTHLNPYQKQIQQQPAKQPNAQSDKVEISNRAKAMQDNHIQKARDEHVQNVKQQVQDGNYDVDLNKTAEKLASFFRP
ncbi:flagellar biosynthesis anti-sigma factor FlgM [Alkalibacillus sp. S2W]|uniref:Negative regulator of flagellin synthesis n=1 Tax=Alkalibacillus salilacus TaxID=284582 RepID=A0ABT9VFT4_9BACI|nr:flagellar biosynthesis anti-sigma factor FlgM [Alkalibacillus salilacus]MDQ0159660.1 negative regulator of flagellin synthesis FlgM [Alkalibacillus salilacus]